MRSLKDRPLQHSIPWWTWGIWFVVLLVGIILYPELPSEVATHFDINGRPNGFMPKWEVVWMGPAVILILILLWHVLWKIDPKGRDYHSFWPTYRLLGGYIVLFMGFIQLWVIAKGIGWNSPSLRILFTLIGLLIFILSNWLPRLQPNWWLGIRTPWTLSNDEVWRKTHRTAGALGVACAIIAVTAAWIVPAAVAGVTVVAMILAWALASIVLSYVYFRNVSHPHQ